jgi:hypothetical protein
MTKKVIRLTEEQFYNHIKNIVVEALNEIDGKTHARVPNAVNKAMALNQQGQFTTMLNGVNHATNNPKSTTIDHDKVISKVSQTLELANQSLIAPYKDTTYVFYAMNRMGVYVFLTFKLEDIKKLMNGIGILSGEVVFDGTQLSGDVTVDFNRNQVFYKEKGSRYQYSLIIDNRTKPQWDELLKQLRMSLNNRT